MLPAWATVVLALIAAAALAGVVWYQLRHARDERIAGENREVARDIAGAVVEVQAVLREVNPHGVYADAREDPKGAQSRLAEASARADAAMMTLHQAAMLHHDEGVREVVARGVRECLRGDARRRRRGRDRPARELPPEAVSS